MKQGQFIAIMVVVLIALGTAIYGVYELTKPVPAEVLSSYETVNLSVVNSISGTAINPVTKITGVDVTYTRTITPTDGAYSWTSVKRGTYDFEMELSGYYDETEQELVEDTTKTTGVELDLDEVGTFSWGETSATGALTADENNQKVNFTVYLKNTAENTILKSLLLKIYENHNVQSGDNIIHNIDSLKISGQTFSVDDPSDGKWEIPASSLGSISGVDVIPLTFTLQIDVGPAGSISQIKLVVSDLDGVSPETSSTKWLTFTAA